MSTTAVLVIVVAAGEANSAAMAGLRAAAESALATGTSVAIVEVAYPSDDATLRIEDELQARASVALVWEDSAHLQARLRLHIAQTDRWTDRLIRFSAADDLRERGRSLGLAVVTMWPEGAAGPRAGSPAAPRPPPAEPTAPNVQAPASLPAPSRLPGPARLPAPSGAETATRDAEAPSRAGEVVVEAEPMPRVRTGRPGAGAPLDRHGVELAAIGSSGVLGTAAGYGGLIDGALFLLPTLSLRAGIALRVGPVPDLPGTDVAASAGAGVEWWPRPPTAARRLALGVRSGLLLLRHQVFATNVNQGTESYGRFVPAAELIPQAALVLGDGIEALVGLGAELAFGATDIRRGPDLQSVASIPPLRIVGQAGVRFRF